MYMLTLTLEVWKQLFPNCRVNFQRFTNNDINLSISYVFTAFPQQSLYATDSKQANKWMWFLHDKW